jgi:hypothetical protein
MLEQPMGDEHFDVRVMRGAREHVGSYTVEDGIVTVFYQDQNRATQLGGSSPDVVARILLSEMVRTTCG